MSNYNIAVAWSGKDALADSNPDKVVSGGDFNTEFTAVQTAVNSKADLAGSASQLFSATTAAEGTNTTQVATTAFVETATSASNIADAVYPIGSIFTTVTVYANSAAVVAAIGGTTWVAFGAGKVLVGLDAADADFDTAEETGGAKTHTLVTAEVPSHSHTVTFPRQNTSGGGGPVHPCMDSGTGGPVYPTVSSSGGDGAHNNVQPYIVVYFWKRTH